MKEEYWNKRDTDETGLVRGIDQSLEWTGITIS